MHNIKQTFFLNNQAKVYIWSFVQFCESLQKSLRRRTLKYDLKVRKLFTFPKLNCSKICENVLIEVRYSKRNYGLWSSNAITASNKLTVTNHITPLSGAEHYFFKQRLSVEPEQRNKLYSHMLWILFPYSHITYTSEFFFFSVFLLVDQIACLKIKKKWEIKKKKKKLTR